MSYKVEAGMEVIGRSFSIRRAAGRLEISEKKQQQNNLRFTGTCKRLLCLTLYCH